MMGRGRARKVENGVLGGNTCGGLSSGNGSLKVPSGPVFYPSEEEFKDPLEYLYKIRPEAEPYGICKIVPPTSWKPPFALDMQSFTFPTKSQAIHQLQARCAPCDPKTFILEYSRFLEERCGKKAKKRIVFDGEDLDLCKLFNVVKRFGGYDNVAKMKKWGEVSRFIRPGGKISECSKHVLSLLYLEHLLDYEEYYSQLNKQKDVSYKHGMSASKICEPEVEVSSIKRRRKNKEGERVELRKVETVEHDQICEQCRSGLHGEVMLLCDRCNRGWHTYCLSPPLKRIPPGNWYCLECLNSEKDSFGFVPGKQYSLEAFRRVADRVKKKWFGSSAISWVQVEKKFWEIVEGSVGEVEVMYGSDLDTSQYGSGFPCRIDQRLPAVEVDDWNKYCTSPWNLNNLPRLKGSMLRAVHQNIAGVMVPWLYVGMLFSSFCWHFEDHCLYSMNYHHWGEPKCWYSVPGNEAHAFEEVMRSSLPDLFEAQPDLLFQLVTMLNPSVLQEKGVPVYSIVQEPGNFVITFPRSYHGGFNLGLNCAEAVNFAPADWLPHGGFGAELYRLYRKIPVLSHEELLLVVSKGEIDDRVSPYLIKELLRVYNNEKSWRERLWKNGIIKSSPMTPRLKPDYVGTEEDPMCVICQQLLYLSAVYCNCRPSTYVCLEHWEHLCECKRNKLRLLYRHSLAELAGLLHEVDKYSLVEAAGDSQNNTTPETAVTLMKKVGSGHVTHLQLAEDWIVRSCKILEQPYSRHAYVSAIEEAEQFLWAGPEMDLVREIQNNLIKAQSCANSVRDCLSKLKSWSRNRGDTDRVQMTHIIELLNLCTLPCKELSYYYQLKEYEEKACKLTQEIKSALTLCSEFSVADLENLYAKAAGSPIYIMECEQLKHKLSSVKVWVENVRYCISQKAPCTVDIDMVYKLELEMLELQHQLPEVDLLTNLIRQVKSCQSRCNEILKDPISLKELKLFLSEWEDLTVNIPELEILRKYYSDTISWISRVHLVLEHIHEREDQEKVVDELTCIQKEGLLLQIKVDELPRIEHELNKARCRVKAFKVLRCQMSLDFVQQLISEATILQIENEKLFVDISQRQAAAVCWEEKARYVLATRAPISDFDDIMRESEDICVVPPSLLDVKLAVSTAKEWLVKAQPYLSQDSSILQASESYSPVDVFKGLVLESEDLKVYLEECAMLKNVLKKSVEWEQDASNLLQNIEIFLNIDIIGEGVTSCLLPRLEDQVISIETSMQAGVALGPQFNTIWRLQDACSILKWCINAVSFSLNVPTSKEVEMTLDAAASVPRTYKSCALPKSLINVLQWLKKSLEIFEPNNHREFDVSCVEEQLDLSKKICISFPFIIGALQDAAQNHIMWLEQIHLFFALSLEDRTWDFFLQLKESGSIKAFKCGELEKVLLEFEKVVKWKQCCVDIVGAPPGVEDPLLSSLTELKSTIESSYQVYSNANNRQSRNLCLYCSTDVEDQDLSTCSICKDSFHLRCMKLLLGDAALFVCTYCNFINSSRLPCTGYGSLRTGSKPIALKELIVLLSDANELCLWTEERRILNQIVEKALECNTSLMELVNFMLAYVNKDLDVISQKICIALKAIDISGVWDEDVNHKFELALARNSWKIRADKLLQTAEKPTLQQIQSLLKEGLEMSIPSEDYFNQKLTYLWKMGLQWAETANKVSMDGGVLELHRVFELISEGEHLPISCSEELKLLRDRSMLYCICRRPYDQRAMIACDKCDEWYHFDCVEISSAPKFYKCPACDPHPKGDTVASARNVLDRCAAGKFDEPQTPLRRSELRRNSPKRKPISKKILKEMDMNNNNMSFTSGERLLWRQRKPFSRAARKRSELQSLSPFFHVQNK